MFSCYSYIESGSDGGLCGVWSRTICPISDFRNVIPTDPTLTTACTASSSDSIVKSIVKRVDAFHNRISYHAPALNNPHEACLRRGEHLCQSENELMILPVIIIVQGLEDCLIGKRDLECNDTVFEWFPVFNQEWKISEFYPESATVIRIEFFGDLKILISCR